MTTPRRGFTLLETLLALALIILLFGAMYTFANQAAASRKSIQADAARHRSLTDVFDSIERAALTSLAGDRSLGAGVSSAPGSLTIVHRQGAALVRQNWKFDESAGIVSVTTRPIALADTSKDLAETSAGEVWVEGVAAVRLRFLKNRLWTDSFDSLSVGSLPDAIEISVWIAGTADRSSAALSAGDAPAPVLQRPPDRQRLIALEPPAGGPT